MEENVYSATVEGVRLKLRALSGLMMGVNGDAIDKA